MERLLMIICIVIMSIVSVVPLLLRAEISPKNYLKVHNDARAEVGVKPLDWDPQLALYARKFVEKHIADCRNGLMDAAVADDTYGQNKAYAMESQIEVSKSILTWVNQKHNYDYKSNTCIDGTIACHCYTQIVWDTTIFLGCASVECHNYGGTLITCLYSPEGNLPNQRPYKLH
ncbi:hypothetical protein PIB30_052567 [Stylosanthes scabra]|uniref:SCP domain-containing protein n=1 Tax=Stylosanthes scabra TaxID=79078 RepID=A0ABU6XJ49_9FABA|nr:hypothetical protein [Stylosanthes scabra]